MLLLKVIGKNAAAFLKITKGRSYIYVYYFADWGSYFNCIYCTCFNTFE